MEATSVAFSVYVLPHRLTHRVASVQDTTTAGNVVLVVLVGGLTLAWTATYVGRVVSKDMTYVKQLDAYEQAVMAKRLEELPETELSQLLGEVDAERLRREKKDSSKPQE